VTPAQRRRLDRLTAQLSPCPRCAHHDTQLADIAARIHANLQRALAEHALPDRDRQAEVRAETEHPERRTLDVS
jgi:hypothetical protein